MDTPVSGERPHDLTGIELGGYRVLRRLGSGGMADVWLAEQRSLGRHVAVKTLKRDRLDASRSADGGDASIARFELEARAAAALVHGNIVQIHEIGCVDGIHFIAEEYVGGPTLKHWLEMRGPLSAEQGLSLLSQVAAALEVAFQKGIVHRDIKPDNLLLTPAGEVKVADFGLARLAQDPAALQLTQDGFTLGTPLYMSPEQVEGRAVDGRSDLYSLGATAYHLLAGVPPFTGETSLSVALAHVRMAAPVLTEARPDLPAAICTIVDRLLEKDSAARFQRPAELLAAVEDAARAAGIVRMQQSLAWPDWQPPIPAAGGAAGARGQGTGPRFGRTSPGGSLEAARARHDATLRLAMVMEEEERSRREARRFWLGTAAASCLLFAVGYGLARGRPRRWVPRRPP
jgi:serine/threonine protein kinase